MPKPTPTGNPTTDNGNIVAMFAEKINNQQESLKETIDMMAGYKNQLKQFKANYLNYSKYEHSAGNFDKRKWRMPPWMYAMPTSSSETRQWDDCTWHFCALCKQGLGGWSPSHSTKGDPAKGITAHGSGKPTAKRDSNETKTPPTKFCFANHHSKYCRMQANFAPKGRMIARTPPVLSAGQSC
jgi:hypothetical protein